jgi:hypothetical protein
MKETHRILHICEHVRQLHNEIKENRNYATNIKIKYLFIYSIC